jgi:hypothetical protein
MKENGHRSKCPEKRTIRRPFKPIEKMTGNGFERFEIQFTKWETERWHGETKRKWKMQISEKNPWNCVIRRRIRLK